MPKISDKSNETAMVKVGPKVLDLDLVSSSEQPVSEKQLEVVLEAQRQVARTLQSFNPQPYFANLATSLKKVVEVNNSFAQVINQSTQSYKNLFETIQESIKRPVEIVRNSFSQMGSFYKKFIEGLKKPFEPFIRLLKSNFYLIIQAADGEPIALHQLGRLWIKMYRLYARSELQKGRKPSKKEFQLIIQTACWEVLKSEESKPIPLLELARQAFYSLAGLLLADYSFVTNEKLNSGIELQVLNGNYKSNVKVYRDESNQPHLFVKTVAMELGVSEQTVRNWIKDGKIDAIKVSYFSKLKQAFIPAYLLPYETSTITELKKLKGLQEKRKLHQMDGFYTRSQAAQRFPVSTRTLARWEMDGKLVPTRIKGIRYYTEDQVNQIPFILRDNQSPKIKGLLARYNPAF